VFLSTLLSFIYYYFQVRNNLGAALLASGRHQEGVEVLMQALESDPNCGDCHVNLGSHWAEEGFELLAVQHYASALELNPQLHGLRFRVAMLMPAIPPSARAVVQRRRALKRNVADLLARTPAEAQQHASAAAAPSHATSAATATNVNAAVIDMKDGTSVSLPPLSADAMLTVPLAGIVSAVERMHFYVQYAGWNDRPLQTSIARFYVAVCPELLNPSPQLAALSDQSSSSQNGVENRGRASNTAERGDAIIFGGSNQYLLPNSVEVASASAAKFSQHQQQRQGQQQPPTRVGFLSKFFGEDEPHGELLEGIVYALKVFRDSRLVRTNAQSSGSSSSSNGGGNGVGRKAFVSVVLHVASPGSKCSEMLANAADEVIELSLHWLGARAAVAKASLDVLIFADSLSEPLSYFLQMGRLAPVQCLFWGNPVTSGKSNIDYFISADRMELPHRARDVADLSELSKHHIHTTSRGGGSDSNGSVDTSSESFDGTFSNQQIGDVYSEQVVLLAGQGIWYRRPRSTDAHVSQPTSMEIKQGNEKDVKEKDIEERSLAFRRSLGLEDHWTVHMCAQSLFKLHPSYDYVLRDVLLNDPNAHVVLTADRRERWTAAFKVCSMYMKR